MLVSQPATLQLGDALWAYVAVRPAQHALTACRAQHAGPCCILAAHAGRWAVGAAHAASARTVVHLPLISGSLVRMVWVRLCGCNGGTAGVCGMHCTVKSSMTGSRGALRAENMAVTAATGEGSVLGV